MPATFPGRFIPACAGNALPAYRHQGHIPVHPACAGNALPAYRHQGHIPVHPRVCGERLHIDIVFKRVGGSSPRVRGTLFHHFCCLCIDRFIPACAGNAQASCSHISLQSVHPRVCGERPGPSLNLAPGNGSSPRVRGTHNDPVISCVLYRFIPACAGNASPGTHFLPV